MNYPRRVIYEVNRWSMNVDVGAGWYEEKSCWNYTGRKRGWREEGIKEKRERKKQPAKVSIRKVQGGAKRK